MRYIFTLTTGRSGTAWLAKLLSQFPDTQVHHERLKPDDWGLNTPDISTLMEYNTKGNTERVRQFWLQKVNFLETNVKSGTYVETSHTLGKAGLIENLDLFPEHNIVLLERNPIKVMHSMMRRGDYKCLGNMWIWLLDPGYALNHSRPKGKTQKDLCQWYVSEMNLRIQDLLTKNRVNTVLHKTGIHETGPLLKKLGYTGAFYDPGPVN